MLSKKLVHSFANSGRFWPLCKLRWIWIVFLRLYTCSLCGIYINLLSWVSQICMNLFNSMELWLNNSWIFRLLCEARWRVKSKSLMRKLGLQGATLMTYKESFLFLIRFKALIMLHCFMISWIHDLLCSYDCFCCQGKTELK